MAVPAFSKQSSFYPGKFMPLLLKRWIIILVLLGCSVVTACGYTDRALSWCGIRYITQENNDYLDDAFNKSLAGFLLLSSIKSGLAVIEGSEVGIGFNLQLGDIVQPVYDYVNIAWKTALIGGTIIVGMQLTLKGLTLVDHWILAAMFFFLGIRYLTNWLIPKRELWRKGLNEAIRLAITLSLVFYLLLPLSLIIAAALSHQITGPLIEESHRELKRIEDKISFKNINKESLAALAGKSFAAPSLKNRLTDTTTGIQMTLSFLKTETDRIAALMFKLIAAYLFDCILFPLLFGMILVTLFKGGIHYFFDLNRFQKT